MARDALHDTGKFQIIGGFLSPVSDEYKKTGLVAAKHRLEMCRLAVRDSDWVNVDAWETEQSSYSPSLRVLSSLKLRLDKVCSGVQVMFLAGADLVKSFEVPGLWSTADVPLVLSPFLSCRG